MACFHCEFHIYCVAKNCVEENGEGLEGFARFNVLLLFSKRLLVGVSLVIVFVK